MNNKVAATEQPAESGVLVITGRVATSDTTWNAHPNQRPPTFEAYGELQYAYDFLNARLFGSELPNCLITLQRKSARVLGYFSHQRFKKLADGRIASDEIAMNPMHFASRDLAQVLSTLCHEMSHLWQAHFGKPSRSGYHNKEWAAKMVSIGLQPSSTGAPGGRVTGEQVSQYIIRGGAFDIASAELLASGFRLTWTDAGLMRAPTPRSGRRVKFQCPSCGARAWGRDGLLLFCGRCARLMTGGTAHFTCPRCAAPAKLALRLVCSAQCETQATPPTQGYLTNP